MTIEKSNKNLSSGKLLLSKVLDFVILLLLEQQQINLFKTKIEKKANKYSISQIIIQIKAVPTIFLNNF